MRSSKSTQVAPQSFLVSGPLAANFNQPFAVISDLMKREQGEAYSYVLTTVYSQDGGMMQDGSAPNFQGSFVTLFTCKHYMRTFREPKDWEGVWIIGLSGSRAKAKHAVFYMMKVKMAFESYLEFWLSDAIPEETKHAKAAHIHPLGDFYQPKGSNIERYDIGSYEKPIADHVHIDGKPRPEWHKDIGYISWVNKRPAYLVGDPHLSFIWSDPTVYPTFKAWRGQKKIPSLSRFEDYFEERLT